MQLKDIYEDYKKTRGEDDIFRAFYYVGKINGKEYIQRINENAVKIACRQGDELALVEVINAEKEEGEGFKSDLNGRGQFFSFDIWKCELDAKQAKDIFKPTALKPEEVKRKPKKRGRFKL